MLTKRQQDVYHAIVGFIDKNKISPTASELAEAIGIRSRGVIHRYLKVLQEAGVIALHPGRHRNISLLPQPVTIPLLGQIAAGTPVEAIADQQLLDLATYLVGKNRFALSVQGQSMSGAGIFEGDIIICDSTTTAQPGDIVVALVDAQEVTLKYWQPQGSDAVTLQPANDQFESMTYLLSRVHVQGVYRGLLRLP